MLNHGGRGRGGLHKLGGGVEVPFLGGYISCWSFV